MNQFWNKPEELKIKIEEHFKSIEYVAEFSIPALATSGDKIYYLQIQRIFNGNILKLDISFNKQREPLITKTEGLIQISDLIKILAELNSVLESN